MKYQSNARPLSRVIAGALRFAHLLGLPSKDMEASTHAPGLGSTTPYALRATESKRRSITDRKQTAPRSRANRAPPLTHAEPEQGAIAKERRRCAAIFRHGFQMGLTEFAYRNAFETELTQSQAIALLNAAALDRPTRGSLAERMAEVSVPNVGAGEDTLVPDIKTPRGAAQAILAAGEMARKGNHQST